MTKSVGPVLTGDDLHIRDEPLDFFLITLLQGIDACLKYLILLLPQKKVHILYNNSMS